MDVWSETGDAASRTGAGMICCFANQNRCLAASHKGSGIMVRVETLREDPYDCGWADIPDAATGLAMPGRVASAAVEL
jgi:hypothetical protein